MMKVTLNEKRYTVNLRVLFSRKRVKGCVATALFAVGCLNAPLTRGDDPYVVFPNADGTGDLASDAAWGETPRPTGDEWTRITSEGVYQATRSTDVQGLRILADNVVLDQRTNASAVITAKFGLAVGYPHNGLSVSILGGAYDFCGTGRMGPTYDWGAGENETLTIDGGAVFSNVGFIRANYHTTGNRLFVQGQSKVYTKEFRPFVGKNDVDGRCELRGGAQIMVSGTGADHFKFGGEGSARDVLLVSGEGTLLTNTVAGGTMVWGDSNTHDMLAQVEDHACLYYCGAAYIWNGQGCFSNRIVVTGNADMGIGGVVYFPKGGASCFDNTLEVSDGAAFSNAGDFKIDGTRTEIIVSNGTFKVSGAVEIGRSAATTGACVRLSGPQAEYSVGSMFWIFNDGSGHLFEMSGRAALSWTGAVYMNCSAQTNVLSLLDGATLSFPSFNMRSYYRGTQACGNTVFVGKGAEFAMSDDFSADWWDNQIVVSNGTLMTGSSIHCFGDHTAANGDLRGNALVLQGQTPMVKTDGMFYFGNNSRLVLDLPEGGYRTDRPLMTALKFVNDQSTSLEVKNVTRCLQTLTKKKDITVLKTDNGLADALDDVIAVANEQLSAVTQKAYFRKNAQDNELHLILKPDNGMAIILR